MKVRSTVNALLVVTGSLLAAKKAARNTRVASGSVTPDAKVTRAVTETRPLLIRLTPQTAV